MHVKAKIKKFGAKVWTDIKINLPESVKEVVDKHNIELVEYPGLPSRICIYISKKDKPEEDVVSHMVYNQNTGRNMSQGFKEALGALPNEKP